MIDKEKSLIEVFVEVMNDWVNNVFIPTLDELLDTLKNGDDDE